jgi:hypothetical protein
MGNLGANKYFSNHAGRSRDLRVKSPEMRRTFEVSRMWEVHHEITRLILLGYKNSEIAVKLRVSPIMVSYTRNSRVVKDRLEEMKGARDLDAINLSKEIKEKAPQALKLLENIINGEGQEGEYASVNLRAKTAENWLDRAGYQSQKSGVDMHLHAHFNAREIEELKRRAVENGSVVKISPKEVDCGVS